MNFYNKIKNMHLNANRWGELFSKAKLFLCFVVVFSDGRKLFNITVFSFYENATSPSTTNDSGGSESSLSCLDFLDELLSATIHNENLNVL